jgi:hypothetical protein
MTRAQRASPENGIWMCAPHARDLDNDEVRYPVRTLRAWKAAAELRARDELGKAAFSELNDPLTLQLVDVTSAAEVNQAIGEALLRSGARECLGVETASAMRDVLIETTKNAFQHGGASSVTLSIEPRRIVLTDDGGRFDPTKLPGQPGRGGRISFRVIQEQHSELVLFHDYIGRNQLTIIPVSLASGDLEPSPCTLVVAEPAATTLKRPISTQAYVHCDTVLVRLPWYLSPSDAYEAGARLAEFQAALDCKLVLIVPECSKTTLNLLQEFVPTARLVHAPNERRS